MNVPVITIDGPSGAGKGTLAIKLARHTGFHLLDSGALYRITALVVLRQGIALDDVESIVQVASNLDICFRATDGGVAPILSEENVASAIREERMGMAASTLAAIPALRVALLQRQRDFCQWPGLVADGRDMGTVIFPDAKVKFFITASPQERARRRVSQLRLAGAIDVDEPKILADIQARDEQDRSRKTAPLIPALDAMHIDTTNLTVDDVFSLMTKALGSEGVK